MSSNHVVKEARSTDTLYATSTATASLKGGGILLSRIAVNANVVYVATSFQASPNFILFSAIAKGLFVLVNDRLEQRLFSADVCLKTLDTTSVKYSAPKERKRN